MSIPTDAEIYAHVQEVNKKLGRGNYDPRKLELKVTEFKMGTGTCSGRYMGHYILNSALREHLHTCGVRIEIGSVKTEYHKETNDISFTAKLR